MAQDEYETLRRQMLGGQSAPHCRSDDESTGELDGLAVIPGASSLWDFYPLDH